MKKRQRDHILVTITTMSITLQIASDLHLEFLNEADFNTILTPSADVLALVGDIGSPLHPLLEQFLAWCSNHFQQVYFIHGNHELYSNDPNKDANILITMMDQMCEKWSNVMYLHNRTHIYRDVFFIGSTLWSHIPQDLDGFVSSRLNDYRLIYSKPGVRMTPEDSRNEFQKNKAFLEDSVNQAITAGYWPVILTHHVPWMTGTSHPRHNGQPQTCAFATDLPASSDVIQLWAAGHTHYNFNHTLAGYPLVSNQRGYCNCLIRNYNMTFSREVKSRRS